MARTFLEKLNDDTKGLPRVQPLTGGMLRRFGEGLIVLPSAREVDTIMRRVRKGRLVTINQIREALAIQHGADMACPIVTGIHARIAAGAAGELLEAGRKRVTPYWRTVKERGELNQKYPGGVEGQAQRLRAEGHEIERRGKRWFVAEHERALVTLDTCLG